MSNKKYLKYLIICVWSFVGFLISSYLFYYRLNYISLVPSYHSIKFDTFIDGCIIPIFAILSFLGIFIFNIIEIIKIKKTC